MQATTKDLRLHTRELIAATERGEQVIITFRGKPRAMLTAFEAPTAPRSERNPAFGLWADASDGESLDVDEEVRAMRKPRSFA
ncbi:MULTISPECIES: type II toxin-antitoxin system Phd/YefM family antitoxin [Thiorhodovibrio]|uniref:type II toxin-antitoxin system Phd/YefM family antitoxin n=1 Tax=Thiorhodovibrio TaxID=61593 RepID=UPI0019128154|nr:MULTISPECIES: type II toxin-antitoxin system prevent-host-death family antitoxin [Thiorhodovibrio]MBK5969885.1 prevent-host-death family protein [Thiorhodovibrio winogradskyi]WPL12070.1 Antitoxin of toxin-antitoxin stability system [Thiorhodovibrio litoralis]